MASGTRRKKRHPATASLQKQKRAPAPKSGRPKSETPTRKELTENQIAEIRKELLRILAVAIRKTMETETGTDIAKIMECTPSQISMLSKGKKYYETFSIEKILSVMLNYYNIKIIVGDLNKLNETTVWNIKVSKM